MVGGERGWLGYVVQFAGKLWGPTLKNGVAPRSRSDCNCDRPDWRSTLLRALYLYHPAQTQSVIGALLASNKPARMAWSVRINAAARVLPARINSFCRCVTAGSKARTWN
eukprot:362855-Chlamydomonas_euryale.AAC.9